MLAFELLLTPPRFSTRRVCAFCSSPSYTLYGALGIIIFIHHGAEMVPRGPQGKGRSARYSPRAGTKTLVSNFIQTPPVNERILPESSHI